MQARESEIIERLVSEHALPLDDYAYLLESSTADGRARLAHEAVAACVAAYGARVFARGLIEFSNYCKNDCLYCGIRRSNASCERYRLSQDDILACTDEGYRLGFRTFVLQSGEDGFFDDARLCAIVKRIKTAHPDCAITLSVGERSRESYAALRRAGADRYLLRHEAIDAGLYRSLHPASMSQENRLRCLEDLRDLGYAVGAGFMVGAPGQTALHLAADLKFIERFQPEMCGIGPFVAHHATPFAREASGSVELTCLLLSIIRLIRPTIMLPATTALETVDERGREKGVLAGANVVMPNLSPMGVRRAYELYDNKACTGDEAAEGWRSLEARMQAIGFELAVDRGDPR